MARALIYVVSSFNEKPITSLNTYIMRPCNIMLEKDTYGHGNTVNDIVTSKNIPKRNLDSCSPEEFLNLKFRPTETKY